MSLGVGGDLLVTGSFSQGDSGTTVLVLRGDGPGDYGRVLATRDVQLGGGLIAVLDPGYQPQLGDTLGIISTSGGTRQGTYADAVLPELGGGLRFQIAYGPAGVALNVVPEPVGFSTLALVAQAWLLRRRQHVPRS